MKNIKLLPHNEFSYEKLSDFFKYNQKGSINHATGTGKSFIILKYLYENKNKRILYLAPTYPILDQLINEHMGELNIDRAEFIKFDAMIYRNLLDMNMKDLARKYDIVVFDEYHRCGAEKWGIKVKELVKELEKNYPNTKIIGTTATEIRYLDYNKNMNDILFDGKEISRLTLADAILDGILPAPIYVNFDYNLIYNLISLEKKVDRYAFYEEDKIEYLKKIQKVRNEIEKSLSNKGDLKKYIMNSKKILVFSSTIKKIDVDKKYIENLIEKVDNSYIIHSKQSKINNLNLLNKFRYAPKNETSVLYSIYILNEGVHVKDVDSIIMLRHTNSPIIYFQQLGRLLSYSRRKDQVVVLDFVNNIKNNPIIYELYKDVCEKAKQRINNFKEKKEHYEEILKRFKIVDETSKICDEIDELKKELNKNSILERRLYTAIGKLEKNELANEAELFQAQLDIIKYEEYITLDMYDKIKNIDNILKPSVINLDREEFVNYLDGHKSIHDKNSVDIKDIYKLLINFFNINNKLPYLFSSNSEEVKIAKLCTSYFDSFSKKMKKFILNNANNDFSLFEKVTYGINTEKKVDIDILSKETNRALKLGCQINTNIYLKLINELSTPEIEELFSLQSKSVKKNNLDIKNEIIFRKDFEKITAKVNYELKSVDIDRYIENLYLDIIKYITENKKEPEFYSNTKEISLEERELYCKKIIFYTELEKKGYIEKINKIILDIKTDSNYYMIKQNIDKLIKFMKENKGAIPSDKNKDNEEILLSKFYKKYEKILRKEDRDKILEVQNKYKYQKLFILNKYIAFLKSKGRKPIENYTDEYEQELYREFNRWFPYYDSEELQKVKVVLSNINEKDALRKVYLQYKKHK